MTQEQKEQLQQAVVSRYQELPEDLKSAMMSVSSAEIVYEIGKRYNLDIEKIGILAEEVGYIMLGLVEADNFVSDIKKLLVLEEGPALEIAREVNNKIFLPVRETLKNIYGDNFPENITATEPKPKEEPAGIISQAAARPPESLPVQTPEEPAEAALEEPEPEKTETEEPAPAPSAVEGPAPEPIPASKPEPPAGLPIAPLAPSTVEGLAPAPIVKLPEVEEELKPKEEPKPSLMPSLPKQKPLEARIAEKNPAQYHKEDPYRETTE